MTITRIPGSSTLLECINCSVDGRYSSDLLYVQQSIETTDLCPRCAERELGRLLAQVRDHVSDMAKLVGKRPDEVLADIAAEAVK